MSNYYVELSSIFDSPPYYQKDKIASVLKAAGLKNVHFEHSRGWSNQPQVVVFTGDVKKATKAIEDAADDIHPLIKKWGVMISKKDWRSKSESYARDLIDLAEDDSSYYVVTDPKSAENIKRSGKDDKAAFKGTAKDAANYANQKMHGKDAVLMKRGSDGKYTYAVDGNESKSKQEEKNMSRAKEIIGLVESAKVEEMYALGADHIVNFLKKTAYERFDVDPSSISVVPWPEDGSDFNISTPLTEDQYNELSEKITRTYPLYVVEWAGDGTMKFYSGRTVGQDASDTVLPYPREGEATTNAPGTPTGQSNPTGRENDWKNIKGRVGYDL